VKSLLEGRSILIVDDESELREILAEEFEALGATVRTAGGGNEAYSMYEQALPDVILSDVRMSGGDGIALLNRVRLKSPTAPPYFFLLTGFAETEEVQLLSPGSVEMITKPFSLRSLRDRVVAVCASFK
jgi:CheY-like chemotaxis protein